MVSDGMLIWLVVGKEGNLAHLWACQCGQKEGGGVRDLFKKLFYRVQDTIKKYTSSAVLLLI